MHYANGGGTKCKDVLPTQFTSCSDLNTTTFIQQLITIEKPDLVVFSGMFFSSCAPFFLLF